MDTAKVVLQLLDQSLNLGGRTAAFRSDTALVGALPELDSMAVLGVLTALEEHYGFVIDDDEIDGSTFQTVGSLVDFVNRKLGPLS